MPEDSLIGFDFDFGAKSDERATIDLHIDEIAVVTRFDTNGKTIDTTASSDREPALDADWKDGVPPDMTDGFDFLL